MHASRNDDDSTLDFKAPNEDEVLQLASTGIT